MIKVVKSTTGVIIPLYTIKEVCMETEQFPDDGGGAFTNTWGVYVITDEGKAHDVYSAPGFDCKKELFSSLEAVQGPNYRLVKTRYDKLRQAVAQAAGDIEVITL